MTTTENSVEIRLPVREAHDQWAQFEAVHRFSNSGVVSFDSVDEDTTRVSLRAEQEAEALSSDLQCFKDFTEHQNVQSSQDMPGFYGHPVFPAPLGAERFVHEPVRSERGH